MSETRYPALRRYVSETPWALLPSQLLMLREVVGRRIDGDRLSAEEVAEIKAAAPKRNATPSQGAIAVLPLWGILSPHQVSDVSSGPTTALDSWAKAFDALVADPSVSTIVLDVDSLGGSVDLVPETAAKVRAASAHKEIIAVANTRIASAAYWIASQAGTLIVSPSGAVGSIGVYAAHEDISRQLEEDGVTVTLISAGDHKVDGNPFEPLSDEARATIQANIDAYYGMFKADVAKGRGVTVGIVNGSFGQGKMILAADAVNAGMADGIGTLEDTLAQLVGGKPTVGRRACAVELEPALAAAETLSFAPGGRLILAAEALQELAAATSVEIVAEIHETAAVPTLDQPDDLAARESARERLRARVAALNDSGGDTAAGSAAPGGDPSQRKESMVKTIAELTARREEITARLKELDEKAGDGLLGDADEETEFANLETELDGIDESIAKIDDRRSRLATIFERTPKADRIPATPEAADEKKTIYSNVDTRSNLPENLHHLGSYKGFAGTVDELLNRHKEGARRIAENVRFVGAPDKERAHEHVEDVLADDQRGEFARRVILCGDPAYDRAFGKAVMRGRDALSPQEDGLIKAAISESGLGSETPVPITIDPTVMLTSNGQTNPLRAVADVRTITGLTWRGITSAGITAAYESAEGNQVADDSPTFGGGDISVLRVDAYVPFSIEVDMDWPALRGELAKEFADAKDVLEGVKFFTGSGTNEPTGLITALTAATALVKTATTAVFAYTDPKLAANALPVRWDADAQWFAAKSVWSTLEDLLAAAGNADPFSFSANGGAAAPQGVRGNAGGKYRGYEMNYASAMDTAVTTSGKNIMVIGDPDAYVIVDRIGMNIELIPTVFGANQRPTGQRGLFAYWRNNANVRTTNAFQVLQVK